MYTGERSLSSLNFDLSVTSYGGNVGFSICSNEHFELRQHINNCFSKNVSSIVFQQLYVEKSGPDLLTASQ